MFTGIIQEVGEVESMTLKGDMARLRINAPMVAQQVKVGDSVSVSGVCLTAVEIRNDRVDFDAIRTTLGRTTLHGIRRGDLHARHRFHPNPHDPARHGRLERRRQDRRQPPKSEKHHRRVLAAAPRFHGHGLPSAQPWIVKFIINFYQPTGVLSS